jgi:osmotically-inducible protein OsmY
MIQAVIDHELELQAREALAHSHIHDHRLVEVEQVGDTLYLQGRVHSFYHKQLAQEVVRTICQGAQLVNEIDVV